MKLDIVIPFWVLALSYWVHLVATVVWLGGLVTLAAVAWPEVRGRMMSAEQWVALRRRSVPWANLSLALLWVTGFLQMTADDNYEGFLRFDDLWSQAILIKHLGVIGMMVFGFVIQYRIYPALERAALLGQKRAELAAAEQARLGRQEQRLLRLNLVAAAAVLLCTAVATAV